MKVVIAKHAGFCFGVQRAMDIIDQAVTQNSGPVFTLGPVIHNSRVVRSLEKRGVFLATSPEQDFPADACIILPSHGTPAPVVERLKQRGLKMIDAACPRVLAIHKRVNRALDQKRAVYLAGEPGHAETAASAAIRPGAIRTISCLDDIEHINPGDVPSFLAVQTTFSRSLFHDIRVELARRIQDLDVFDSVCGHTLQAQQAARDLAAQSDIMVVVGGRQSANTRRLRDVCRATGVRVRCVEKASDLRRAMFRPHDRVGITAGASTPQAHILEGRDWLSGRFEIN